MRDLFALFMSHARGVWRYRWVVMITAWIVTLGSWVAVYQMPDQYTSTARVYVDTRTILRPLLRGLAVDTDVSRQLRLMTRILLSRPNLEKVARMTDLDLQIKSTEEMDELVDDLAARISISTGGRGQENLYQISAEHDQGQLAKRIVQSLLTIFVESTLGETRKDSDTAQRFLDTQIKEYEIRLQEAEDRLKEFKHRNFGLMPGQGGDYYTRLQSAADQLETARLDLREAQNRRNELKRQLRDGESVGSIDMIQETSYDSRIDALHERMDEVLLRYTAQHPDVLAIQDTIAELEAKRDEELAEMEEEGVSAGATVNPVYQQLQINLGQAEANVASMAARVGEFEARIATLKEQVDASLEVEKQFKNLNRDYEVTKQNYDSLLSRRETARLSEEADQSAENVKFRIVDPPYVPSEPSAPNRPLWYSGALLLGIAVGVGLALFVYLIRPTFDSRRTLKEVTGLPVLGSVTMTWTDEQRSRRRAGLIGFAAASAALLVLFSTVMTIELLQFDIASVIEGVKEGGEL